MKEAMVSVSSQFGVAVVSMWLRCYYRSVPQIRPPFCNLSLSTKHRGGLYAGCDNFSRDYAFPSGHEVIVGGVWGPSVGRRQAQGGEMLTTLAIG